MHAVSMAQSAMGRERSDRLLGAKATKSRSFAALRMTGSSLPTTLCPLPKVPLPKVPLPRVALPMSVTCPRSCRLVRRLARLEHARRVTFDPLAQAGDVARRDVEVANHLIDA